MKNEKLDLDLVSTDDLMDELFDRFDHAVFAGVKAGTANGDFDECHWAGHLLACAGMTANLQRQLLREYNRPLNNKGRKRK